jgi:hypothetical protein
VVTGFRARDCTARIASGGRSHKDEKIAAGGRSYRGITT